jgi:hypothetical protein
MACTTISALFLLAMLGIVAMGAMRSPAKANSPAQHKEVPAEGNLRSPKVA